MAFGFGTMASAQVNEDPIRVLDRVVVEESNVPSIEDLVAEPTVSNMELSPNGKFVAGVRRDGDNYFLVVADVTKPEIQFTGTRFEDLRIFDVRWANDDRIVVEAAARFDGNTRSLLPQEKWYDPGQRAFWVPALYGINRDGTDLIRYFEGDRQMDNIFTQVEFLSFLRSKPGTMLVTLRAPEINNKLSGGFELGGADVYEVNTKTGEFQLYERGNARTQTYETDKDGQLRYRIDTNSLGNRNIYYVAESNERGKVKWTKGAEIDIVDVIDELESPFKFQLIAPAEQAPLFFALDRLEGQDRQALYVYNIQTGEHVETVAEHPEFDMGGAIFDPNTDELIGVWWEGEKSDMIMFDPEDQRHVEALFSYVGDQKNLQILDMSEDGSTWLIAVTGPGHPGYYAVYDKAKVKVTEIAVRNARMAGKATYDVEVFRYKARDGQDLFAYVTMPAEGTSKGPLPFVMYPHGGPQARDSFAFDDMAQLLASRGYVVIQPQFRGSNGFGKRFAEIGYRKWGTLMQEDVEDALNALVAKGVVDPDRGCIKGYSYGGYAAMQGAVKTPDAFRCVIAGGGVYDLREMQKWSQTVRGSNSPTFQYWTRQLGDPRDNFDDLIARSPARNLDRLKAPVFLFHGRLDDIVPIEQAEILRERLKAAGATFEYVVMEKSGHSFGGYRTSEPVDIRKDILEFLATYNPTDRNRLN